MWENLQDTESNCADPNVCSNEPIQVYCCERISIPHNIKHSQGGHHYGFELGFTTKV